MTLFGAGVSQKRSGGTVRYRLLRWMVRSVVRPRIAGDLPQGLSETTVYALPLRSLHDLIVLDIVCAQHGLPNPLGGFQVGERFEGRRFVFLARPAGWRRRNTMQTYSERLLRLTEDAAAADVQLLPAQVFWGANRQPPAFPGRQPALRNLGGHLAPAAPVQFVRRPPPHRGGLWRLLGFG